MTYTPHTRKDGELITSQKLNNLENGLQAATDNPENKTVGRLESVQNVHEMADHIMVGQVGP